MLKKLKCWRGLLLVASIIALSISMETSAWAESQLYFDIVFEENFVFDKYNVELYLDNVFIGILEHGKPYTKLIDSQADGQHMVIFYKEDDHNICEIKPVEVKGDTTFSCKVVSHSEEISVSNIATVDNVDASRLKMVDLTHLGLGEAMTRLKEIGFINIRSEDPKGSSVSGNSYIVLTQSVAPDGILDKNDEIILSCQKFSEYMDEHFLNLGIKDAKSVADGLGYGISFYQTITGADMNDRVSDLGEEESNWKVNDTELKNGTAVLGLVYEGSKKCPNVVGMSLKAAEETLEADDFPNHDYEVITSDWVWDKNNWKVLAQSIEAGTVIDVSSKIELKVQSYESIKRDGVLLEGYTEPENAVESETEVIIDNDLDVENETVIKTESVKEITTEGENGPVDEKADESMPEKATGSEIESVDEKADESVPEKATESEIESVDEKADESVPEKAAESGIESVDEKSGEPEPEKATEVENEVETLPVIMNVDVTAKDTIIAVQNALNTAGFNCGTADGIAGKKTRSAINEFAQSVGFSANGEITVELIAALGIDLNTLSRVDLTKEMALRAAVVAMTNSQAIDVFTPDGSAYDSTKFHSYDDISGFHMTVYSEGDWVQNTDGAWSVSGLKLDISDTDTYIKVDLKVSYDGSRYIVSHVKKIMASLGNLDSNDSSKINEENLEPSDFNSFLFVDAALVENDRGDSTSDTLDDSSNESPQRSTFSYDDGKTNHDEWVEGLFSWWDGSQDDLEDLIKQCLNDERSYKHIETKYLDCWYDENREIVNELLGDCGSSVVAKKEDVLIICQFSAKNAFNATIKNVAYGLASYSSQTVQLIYIE